MKILYFFLFYNLFSVEIGFAQKLDTLPESEHYLKELNEIRVENKILSERINNFNSTNDKILDSIYWTIGTVLAALFGLTIWNMVKNQKFNDEKFSVFIETIKQDLNLSMQEMVEKTVAKKSFADLNSISSKIRTLRSHLDEFERLYYIREMKFHPFNGVYDEHRLFENFFRIAIWGETNIPSDEILETILNYIQMGKYLDNSIKQEILDYIEKELSDDKNTLLVKKIKKLLETGD